MLKNVAKLLVLFVLTVSSNQVSAQSLKLPYSDVGACPFEGCMYGKWTARKETNVLSKMRNGSSFAFKVAKNEKVTAISGIVITLKTGTAKAVKATKIYAEVGKYSTTIKAGESLSILHYQGEGFYLAWYKGRLFSLDTSDDSFKVTKDSVDVWWVKIKNKKGRIGWTKLAENFDGKDRYA